MRILLVLVGGALTLLATVSPAAVAQTQPAGVEAGLDLDQVAVRQIQDVLRQRGFDPGQSDGEIGEDTRTAIRGLQKAYGLAETGFLDFDLVVELLREHQITVLESIAESEDPARFEKFLSAYPDSAYRHLAQARLDDLRGDGVDIHEPSDEGATSTGSAPTESGHRPASADTVQGPKCVDLPPGVTCLIEIDDYHTGTCYVWNPGGETSVDRVMWSGGCEGGIAEGRGDLVWQWADGQWRYLIASGELQGGLPSGHWRLDHRGGGPLLEAEYRNGRIYRSWAVGR